MTDARPHSQDASHDSHDEPHEGPIKTPKQLAAAVVASFVVPIVVIILMANYVSFGIKPAAGTDALGAQAVAQRLLPVGTIEIRDMNAPRVLRAGLDVYNAACAACHNSGAAGAPKIGDGAAWAPRIATGYETLLNSALKGKGAMAAQGGGEYSDLEIARAVVHLVNESGGRFAEPKVPEAEAAPAN